MANVASGLQALTPCVARFVSSLMSAKAAVARRSVALLRRRHRRDYLDVYESAASTVTTAAR